MAVRRISKKSGASVFLIETGYVIVGIISAILVQGSVKHFGKQGAAPRFSMIDYRAGQWGFHVAWGWQGSLAPRALTMAVPNAVITFIIATYFVNHTEEIRDVQGDFVQMVIAAFEVVMIFILYNRSRTSYNRWWEGGTLLQKTRGEWFNAYSSIMAFTSTRPEMQDQVEAYSHCLARLMSLLMCCGLQQVSPYRDRPFSIIDLEGMEPESMEFLNGAPDKVEVILQWVQRSMVLHMQTGVLPVAPPILSRAFQEVSRGIVNLQNARKIADFPYPYPLAQVSMILQLLHWAMIPIAAPLAMSRGWAVMFSFLSIFVLWCIHFNALDLEFPFGDRVNDLPMHDMQQDWNNSVCALLDKRASQPPKFEYDPSIHNQVNIVMSDASQLYVPARKSLNKGNAVIKVSNRKSRLSLDPARYSHASSSVHSSNVAEFKTSVMHHDSAKGEQVMATTAILPDTPIIEKVTFIQSSPTNADKIKPSLDTVSNCLSEPSAPAAISLEASAQEPLRMAPIFLQRLEVSEQDTQNTSPATVALAGPGLHPTTTSCDRALGNRSLEDSLTKPAQVTINVDKLL